MPLLALVALQLARVRYDGGGDWYNDPEVLPNIAAAFVERTGGSLALTQRVVRLTDADLGRYPFLYLTGHGTVRFSEAERSTLREYLENGGFLYADDDYGMDASFRKELSTLFPDRPLEEVPLDDPLFSAFYRFPEGLPKIHEHYEGPPRCYAVRIEGRIALLYTYNSNISDGWTDAHDDTPEKREAATRMGINILVTALSY